jgi:hypothetical protein
MSKQNEGEESIIEISPHRVENSPLPKVLIGPIIAVNMLALAVTSTPKTSLSGLSSERVIIEQGKSIVIYPIIKLKYSNGQVIQDKDEVVNRVPSVENSVIKGETTADITFQQIIGDLRKENAVLKNRLRNSLPIHTLTYMVGSGIVTGIVSTLLLMRVALNVYTIDPYYLICTLIITLGLFLTAFVSLKDWKDNLLDERTR